MIAVAQALILNWAHRTFGQVALSRLERAARLFEEAAEVAQAAGVSEEMCGRILKRTYSRPVGNVVQELGGCAVTLLAMCEVTGNSFEAVLKQEVDRCIERGPSFAAKHAEKVRDGTANVYSLAKSTILWPESPRGDGPNKDEK